MTSYPLYLPAPLIPAFVAGRVSLLVEPLKVQPPGWCDQDRKPGYSFLTPPRHIEFRGRYVDPDGVDHGPASKFIPLPYATGDRLVMDGAWAEVEEVEVKRVQDVTEAECKTAGVDFVSIEDLPRQAARSRRHDFSRIFTCTHGPDAWDRNPWCVFTRVKVHKASLEEKG